MTRDTGGDGEVEFYQHSEWERGSRCPACGTREMEELRVGMRTAVHGDGEVEHARYGEYEETLRVRCEGCGELLLRHPACDSLNGV